MKPENSQECWLKSELTQIRAYAGATQHWDMQSRLIVDLHLDSLEMLELVSSVEKHTEQPLQDEIWMKWYRVQDVLDYLEESTH
ncbi:acyl carrier protein [Yersinia enterocolitica]|uniref:acyl carrier protein n=1 Tax=Yersinia enterocolitica TaxID=630 RepID=UPI0005DDACF0|nr:acyl carrier protein [Yersinia enterocolitica]PNM16157.1 acyl carrier protein [Yersinia enterocolitica]CNK60479.1 acyl carrier protein [Yersinia enterocolitica]CRY18541.1 acyl carrier protein [Yersinia enterocolitica]CRY36725.1 acyl carrier protein [Yersinia enterocolitica]HDL6511395.1 acyl carrier protein [Yersinia enterocolitica]